jgi:hypothetical protein
VVDPGKAFGVASTMSQSLTLPAVPESAAAARRAVSARIAEEDAARVAALMVSELVTSSLTQGALRPQDTITIHTEAVDHGVRVTVCDSAAVQHGGGVAPRTASEVQRHGDPAGLGVKIIARLADRWGLTSEYPGARAWFEVRAHLEP